MKKTITILACSLLLGAAGIAQTTPPAYVPLNGLVGWWPFTGDAKDQSTNANHGTVNGAALTTDRAGNVGAAYSFNGTSDYIQVMNSPSLQVKKSTVATWVYSLSTLPNPRGTFFYKGNLNNTDNETFSFHEELVYAFKINSGCNGGIGWNVSYYNQTVPYGSWIHACSTFDGIYIRNYVNGLLVNSTAVSGQMDVCGSSNIQIGFDQYKYAPRWFNGKLDDMGIWNRALTDEEVNALYKGAPIGMPSGIETIPAVAKDFTLYPNPGRHRIVLQNNGITAKDALRVTLTDITGRVLLNDLFAGTKKELNVEGFASGFYTVAITSVEGVPVFREKLVIQ